MRTITYSINLSIDGCSNHTNFAPDDTLFEYFINLMKETDLAVYGRKTYQLMFPFWADVAKTRSMSEIENEFAQILTDKEKIVFSKSLEHVGHNTRIVRDHLTEEIHKLKQVHGKKIEVAGIDLSAQLIELGLVDEFHFVVHPLLVGKGKRLFDLHKTQNLKLVDAKRFKSGALALHYLKQ
jgi:dihydrofolate reductase